MSVSESNKEDMVVLERVPCIHYLLYFWKDSTKVKAWINSGNKVKALTLAYTSNLGLWAHYTDIGAQKIDDSTLQIFEMVLASFQVLDKPGRA